MLNYFFLVLFINISKNNVLLYSNTRIFAYILIISKLIVVRINLDLKIYRGITVLNPYSFYCYFISYL